MIETLDEYSNHSYSKKEMKKIQLSLTNAIRQYGLNGHTAYSKTVPYKQRFGTTQVPVTIQEIHPCLIQYCKAFVK